MEFACVSPLSGTKDMHMGGRGIGLLVLGFIYIPTVDQ